jgi:hypothetical protein
MLGNSLRLGCIIFSILWANSLEARFYPQSASLTAIATKTNTVASTTETTAADVWFDDLTPSLNPSLNLS